MELPWRVKLRQAEIHLGRFEAESGDYLETADVGFSYDMNIDEGSIDVILRANSEPPMSLGAIVGDVLHNLRSALDSIAWETCQRAGIPPQREKDVYFPVSSSPGKWEERAISQLPNVPKSQLDVFKELQPWHQDEVARRHGIDVDASSATQHPLYQLHEMARRDRHRVPHPILARAGHAWLGVPDGITVDAARADPPPWLPGKAILKWRISPPTRVADVHPDGEAILAFEEDAAINGQSAIDELQSMVAVVREALRRVEIEVLEAVTREELTELTELRRASDEAQDALRALRREPHVIDRAYIDRYSAMSTEVDQARSRYTNRWRELFD